MFEDNFNAVETNYELKSAIACHVCRRRKIKCGRELPHCSVCTQSYQTCEYPEKALRPGPKIGSTQVSRKRKNRDTSGSDGQRKKGQPDPSSPSLSPQRSSSNTADQPRESALPENRATNIQDLGFMIHPSHESCSPETLKVDDPTINGQAQQGSHVAASCYLLGFDPQLLHKLIDRFFDTFTSFQLFRESEFRAKLDQVRSRTECKALLSAILTFALHGYDERDEHLGDCALPPHITSLYFANLATECVDLAIRECADGPISLPILQALILITHWHLIQGVRGQAWRSLGLAVRIAYELNMHLIDANPTRGEDTQSERWCAIEERRRAWWAIWEMDIFASVIRRCPTAIDWSQNETFLPAEDEKWNRGEPQDSCTLQANPSERYKKLEASGNHSSRAWFIVINSFVKDAQKITSPTGVNNPPVATDKLVAGPTASTSKETSRDASKRELAFQEPLNRLRTIQNALQCAVMALPESARYRHKSLCFGSAELQGHPMQSRRLQHTLVYSIHMITQLTKLMIYKYYIFMNGRPTLTQHDVHRQTSILPHSPEQADAFEQYSKASDEIFLLVSRSHEEHYRYVNPFLANTIWLAGAVQLFYREFGSLDSVSKDLTTSKMDLLSMVYNKFVQHWGMSPTLQKNLEGVEMEINNLQLEAHKNIKSSPTTPVVAVSSPARGEQSDPGRENFGGNQMAAPRSDNYLAHQRYSSEAHSIMWSTMEDNTNQFHGQSVHPDSMEAPPLFGNGVVQTQDQFQAVSRSSSSSRNRHDRAYGDSTPVLHNVPTMSQPLRNSVSHLSGITDHQTGFSSETLARLPLSSPMMGTNTFLAEYFGDMLSGAYVG